MHYKTVFVFAVLLIMTVKAGPVQRSEAPLQLVNFITVLEEPCVRQGGICMMIDDCDPGNLVQIRGLLCPRQSHLGVECCYI